MLALVCLAAALSLLPGVAVAASAPQRTSELFVQQAGGGTLERVRDGAFRLRLSGVAPTVSSFTDRPRRRASAQSLRSFVRDWSASGFAADPPNAALVLAGARRSADVAMLTLSRPRYDRARRTLTYRAEPLRGDGGDALASFARRADPVRALRFAAASLFIDNGAGSSYRQVSIEVVGAEPGSKLELKASANGSPVAWSLGPPGNRAPGLQFVSPLQVMPIAQAFIAGEVLVVVTGTDSELQALRYSLDLFLEAEQATDVFYLNSTGSGVGLVSAQIGGGPLVVLGAGPNALPWE